MDGIFMSHDNSKKPVRDGSATRQKILDTSFDLFSEKGYSRTSIREICSRVGIRGSSLYNHFEGKDDIFVTLLRSYGPERLLDKIGRIDFDDSSSPLEILNRIAKAFMSLVENQREMKFIRIIVMELFHSKRARYEFFQPLRGAHTDRLKDIFGQLISRGLFREMDLGMMVKHFLTPIMICMLEYILRVEDDMDMQEIYEDLDQHVLFFYEAVKVG